MSEVYLNASFPILNERKDLPVVIEMAREKLKAFLQEKFPQIERDFLFLKSVEAVVWKNGALGCEKPGHFYTQALVPGYKFIFEVENREFTLHTDESGRQIVSPNFPDF